MSKIYTDFDELWTQNHSIFNMADKNSFKNICRAVWEAREAEISDLKNTIEQLKESAESNRSYNKSLKVRLKQAEELQERAERARERSEESFRLQSLDLAQSQEEIAHIYEENEVLRLESESVEAELARVSQLNKRLREYARRSKFFAAKYKKHASTHKEFALTAKDAQKKAELSEKKALVARDSLGDQLSRSKKYGDKIVEELRMAKEYVVRLNEEKCSLERRVNDLKHQNKTTRTQLAKRSRELTLAQTRQKELLREQAELNQFILNLKNAMGDAPLRKSGKSQGLSLV